MVCDINPPVFTAVLLKDSLKKEGRRITPRLKIIRNNINDICTRKGVLISVLFFHKQMVQVKRVKCISVMRINDRCDARQRELNPGTRCVVYSGVTIHL